MPSSVIYIYKLAPSLEPSLILSPCPLYQYRFSLPDPPFLSTAITNNIVFQVFFTLGLMQTPTRPPIQSSPSLTSICPARLWASFPQLPPPAIKTQTPWFDFQSSPPPAFCLSPAAPFLQLKGFLNTWWTFPTVTASCDSLSLTLVTSYPFFKAHLRCMSFMKPSVIPWPQERVAQNSHSTVKL